MEESKYMAQQSHILAPNVRRKNMIQPVNGHLLIDPVAHEGFMASQKETYEEIGIVVALPIELDYLEPKLVAVGDKVYFDSWLAARYPKEADGEYYWLVKWEDVRAVEVAHAA